MNEPSGRTFEHQARGVRQHAIIGPELHNDLGLIFVFATPCWIFCRGFLAPQFVLEGKTHPRACERGAGVRQTKMKTLPPRETPPGEWSHLVDFSPHGHHSDGAALSPHT